MKGFFWLLGAIFSCLFVSCENDGLKNKTNVTGYWSVQTAFRDKRETRLLADVFFQFGADGKMFTNLPNTAENATEFELKGDQIIQKTTPPITYLVQDITESTMILALEMHNTPFEIHLKKTSPPPSGQADSLTQTIDSLRLKETK